MADTKISALSALTALEATDEFVVVDKSDPGTGTTKRVTWANVGPPLPTFRPEDYGAVGNGSTNDTAAFRSMMAAIDTTKGADIILKAGATYLLNSAPITTSFGNAIVPLPLVGNALGTDSVYPFGMQQSHIRIRSLFGQARILCDRTSDTYSATFGCPSIIGGPTPEVVGAAAEMASLGTVSIENVVFQVPANPKISALDLWYSRRMDVKNVAFITDETWDGTASSVTAPTNVFNFAVRGSYHYGQTRIIYDGVHIAGYYAGIISSQSHNNYLQVIITFCNIGIGLDEATATVDNHPSKVQYLVTHHCIYGIAGWNPTAGAKSLASGTKFHIYGGVWDLEHSVAPWTATQDVLDANNQIYGSLRYHKWPLSVALLVSGGANVNLIDGRAAQVGRLPAARVYNSSTISHTTSGTSQVLTFDSERFDTDTIHSTSSNTGRLTCQTPGIYSITACVSFAANATGSRRLTFRLNGTTTIAGVGFPAIVDASAVTNISLTTSYQLAATDYVEVLANQTSTAALNMVASVNFSPEFSMHYLSSG